MEIQKANFGTSNTFDYELHEEQYNFHLHIHQFVELTLVLEGELFVSIGGCKPERAVAGDFIFMLPFQSHKYSSKVRSKFIIYTFSPSLIGGFLRSLGGMVGERAVFRADDITYRLFTERMLKGEDYSFNTVSAALMLMLSDFERQVPLVQGRKERGVLEKMTAYLNANFADHLPLEDVAKAIGYSVNYLSHNIKSAFGFGYPRLLACIRVEHAKALLLEGKKSSIEIAMECGFGSERSFHRQFREICGVSPKTYKKESAMVVHEHNEPSYRQYWRSLYRKRDLQNPLLKEEEEKDHKENQE